MLSKRVVIIGLALAVLFAGSAAAQWRGLGRLTGKVVDEAGAVLVDVTVRADLPGMGGTTVKTNEKGEWMISGIARGEWVITVAKDGMAIQKVKAVVQEMAVPPLVKTTLKKE
ncbi:MAG TPA: carboxypeptidase-like regulatory domain-containing protein [Vicinamibacterales bacterium]|jgi:hypothetical protein